MLATRMVVNISTGGRLSVCRHARGRACGSAGGGRQRAGGGQLAGGAGDDEVVLIVGEREVEGGGDVLVGAAVGHRDRAAEDSEFVVGADEADELDLASLGPAGGELGERPWGALPARRRGLLGRAPAGGAVAVLGVVEALERACALGPLKCSIVPLRHGSRGGTNTGVAPWRRHTRTTSPRPVGDTNGPPLSNWIRPGTPWRPHSACSATSTVRSLRSRTISIPAWWEATSIWFSA